MEKMSLKKRIEKIVYDTYFPAYNGQKFSKKAAADILKAVELDEEKIIAYLRASNAWSYRVCNREQSEKLLKRTAKAIAQGDVWKGER